MLRIDFLSIWRVLCFAVLFSVGQVYVCGSTALDVEERNVEAELLALAGTAASALVGAVAKDFWGAAKNGVVRLLGRGDRTREAAVEGQLERTRVELEAAGADGGATRSRQEAVWTGRFEDLLIDRPVAAAELRALVDEISSATGSRSAGHVVQQATASGNAQQAVQGHGSQVNTFRAPGGADG